MAKAVKTRWSFAKDRRLMQLAASGKSLETIAGLMKRPVPTIRRVAVRLGISVKAKPKG